MLPSLTVGIPFKDNGATLPLAIVSVFAQTFADWELLLVDDGSRDCSLACATSLSDPRVRVVSDGRTLGLPARLNEIAQLARGDRVARMDGDDVMHPRRLEVQWRYLDEHPEVDVLGTAGYAIDGDDRVYGTRSTRPLTRDARAFLGNDLLLHSAVMARREWFRTNPYNESLLRSQDKELWCRTRETSTFAKILEPLMFIREDGNISWDRYRRQKHLEARVVATYGPRAIGALATTEKLVAIPAKLVLYRLMIAAGHEGVLVRRRSGPLTAAERDRAQLELDRLKEMAGDLAAARASRGSAS